MDALTGTLGKEAPEGGTGEKINGVMGDVATKFEKFAKDDVKNGKHHEGTKKSPKVAKD